MIAHNSLDAAMAFESPGVMKIPDRLDHFILHGDFQQLDSACEPTEVRTS